MELKDEKDFKAEISEGLVVVDFFANWCGPCKMLSPVLEEISQERSKIKILKVDVDKYANISREFGIMSIPTLVIFKDGKCVARRTGYARKEEILDML